MKISENGEEINPKGGLNIEFIGELFLLFLAMTNPIIYVGNLKDSVLISHF